MSQLGFNPNVLWRELAKAGLRGQVDADAFKALLQYYQDVQGDKESLYSVFTALKQDADDMGIVKVQQVEAAIRQMQGTTSQRDLVFVISAFEVPKISYDPISKRLYAESWDSSMLPKAEYKHRLYLDRLNLIYQRLRRNKRFQARIGPAQTGQPQLTELLGLKGCVGQRRIVMGAISSQPDGGYKLEDTGASVALGLEEARVASGFLTENCVVVAEGELGHDGIFHVSALGFPSCEPRGALPASAQKLNFFGGPELSQEEGVAAELAELERTEDRMVFLSNVWLDRQSTFDSLEAIFGGFVEADAIPAMFVLMGDFSSHASVSRAAGSRGGAGAAMDYAALKESFAHLAALIERFPRIVEDSRFVFVPGPGDPGLGDILPQPPLPRFFTSELQRVLPNAVFTTNPCRIRYYTKEVVVFRHDMMKHMRRRCLISPAGLSDDAPAQDAFAHLTLTLLQQSHLCPLPLVVQPVHWTYDHALQLYPLPHAVVVADAAPQAFYKHEGCTVFNPGCLQEKLFAAYVPFQDEVEPSELPGASPE